MPALSNVIVEPSISSITGVVSVLFVRVTLFVNVAKSSSDNAVLNCAVVPDNVLLDKLTVLFVSVSVVALPTRVSVALGKVIVLSAVGSVTVSVVSKSSAVAPSNIILPVVVESPVIAGVAIVGL